jgi:hypothetical protein
VSARIRASYSATWLVLIPMARRSRPPPRPPDRTARRRRTPAPDCHGKRHHSRRSKRDMKSDGVEAGGGCLGRWPPEQCLPGKRWLGQSVWALCKNSGTTFTGNNFFSFHHLVHQIGREPRAAPAAHHGVNGHHRHKPWPAPLNGLVPGRASAGRPPANASRSAFFASALDFNSASSASSARS